MSRRTGSTSRKPARRGRDPKFARGAVAAVAVGIVVVGAALWLFTRSNSGTSGTSGAGVPPIGGDLHSLVVDPSRAGRLYVGGHSGADVSNDGGKTLTGVPAFEGVDAMAWVMSPNGRTQFVGGHSGARLSTDGGASWHNVAGLPGDDIHSVGMDPQTPSHLFAAVAGRELAASTDDGATWQTVSPVGAGFMGPIIVGPGGQQLLAPDMQNGIVRSSDAGKTWARQAGGSMTMATWLSQDPSNPAHILAIGQENLIESRDGGLTWAAKQAPPNTSAVAIGPGGSSAWYAGVLVDQTPVIYRSTDGGANWSKVTT